MTTLLAIGVLMLALSALTTLLVLIVAVRIHIRDHRTARVMKTFTVSETWVPPPDYELRTPRLRLVQDDRVEGLR